MLYSAARPLIQSGDLLAWRGRTPLGRLIRAVTGGSWTHLGVAVHLYDRLFSLEAIEGVGTRLALLSELTPFDWLATDAVWSDDIAGTAFERLGRPYSYTDAALMGVGLPTVMGGDICSEVAHDVLRACGARGLPANPLPPAGLVEAMMDAGCPFMSVRG